MSGSLPNRITIVARACGRALGVSLADMLGPSRRAEIVEARHMAIALGREFCGYSQPRLARVFKRKDHTVIHHALKTWPERAARPHLAQVLPAVRARIEDDLRARAEALGAAKARADSSAEAGGVGG